MYLKRLKLLISFFITFISFVFIYIPEVKAQVTINTTSDASATQPGHTRRVVVTSEGTYHTFIQVGTESSTCGGLSKSGLLWFNSTDDGATWVCQGQLSSDTTNLFYAAAVKDASDNIYVAYATAGTGANSAYDVFYRKVTKGSGSNWTLEAEQTVLDASASVGYSLTSIEYESASKLWLSVRYFDGYNYDGLIYSSNSTGTAPTWTADKDRDFDKVWSYVASSYLDDTTDANDEGGADTQVFSNSGDIIYFGNSNKFDEVSWHLSTIGVGGLSIWEYWNGTSWSTLPTEWYSNHYFTTTAGGYYRFRNPGNWVKTSVNGEAGEYYYVRNRATSNYSTPPVANHFKISHFDPSTNSNASKSVLLRMGNRTGFYASTYGTGLGFRFRDDAAISGLWVDEMSSESWYASVSTSFSVAGTNNNKQFGLFAASNGLFVVDYNGYTGNEANYSITDETLSTTENAVISTDGKNYWAFYTLSANPGSYVYKKVTPPYEANRHSYDALTRSDADEFATSLNPFDKVWRYQNSSYSDITDKAKKDDAGYFDIYLRLSGTTYTVDTTDAKDTGTSDVTMPVALGDIAYFGKTSKFSEVQWDMGTNGTAGVIAWEYWNGTTWTSLTLADSQNPNFLGDGFVSFTEPGDWQEVRVNGNNLYWVRARATTGFSNTPTGSIFRSDSIVKKSTSSDAIYFGKLSQFNAVTWGLSTNGTGGVIAWEYWNGSSWSNLTTSGSSNPNFQGNGYITFNTPGNWATTTVNGEGTSYYYVRARATTGFTLYPDQLIFSYIRTQGNITVPEFLTTTDVPIIWTQTDSTPDKVYSKTLNLDVENSSSIDFVDGNYVTTGIIAESTFNYKSQNTIIRTSDGTLHIFVDTDDKSTMLCSDSYQGSFIWLKSTDNGDNWICGGQIDTFSYNSVEYPIISVTKDDSDNIYVAWSKKTTTHSTSTTNLYDIWFTKLTKESGTNWTIGPKRTALASTINDNGYSNPSIVWESTNNRLWLAASFYDRYLGASNRVKISYSNGVSDNPTWTNSVTNDFFDKYWSYVSSVYTDDTTDASDSGTGDVQLFTNVDDIAYFGKTDKFNSVSLDLTTSGTNGRVLWEYWNGSSWSSVQKFDMRYNNQTISGDDHFIFEVPADWATTSVNGEGSSYYYVRARVTSGFSVSPVGAVFTSGISATASAGSGFSIPQLVRYGTKTAVIYINPSINLMGGNLYMRTRDDSDGLSTWSTPIRVTENAFLDYSKYPFRAVGTSDGKIFLTYVEQYYNQRTKFTYFNGTSWSEPVQIFQNHQTESNNATGFSADVMTNGDDVWVVGHDASMITSGHYIYDTSLPSMGVLSYKHGVSPYTSSDFDTNPTKINPGQGTADKYWHYDSSSATYTDDTTDAQSVGNPDKVWRYFNSSYKDVTSTLGDHKYDSLDLYIYKSGSAWSEDTWDMTDSSWDDSAYTGSSGDEMYFGKISEQFDTLYWTLGTAGVGGTVVWEYWNGSSWAALSLTESSNPNFTSNDGYIMFNKPNDWSRTSVGPALGDYYFVRARVTGNYSTTPIGHSMSTEITFKNIGDYLYLGNASKFSAIYGYGYGEGLEGTVNFEYWDGNSWETLNRISGNSTNYDSGIYSFEAFDPPGDWQTTSINGEGGSYYYVRIAVTDSYTHGPAVTWQFSVGGDTVFPGDVNDIAYIGKTQKFENVVIDTLDDQVEFGRHGDYIYEYWNGSAWTTITQVIQSANTNLYGSYADHYLSFKPNNDWATTSVNGEGQSYYYIRIRCMTKPMSTSLINQVTTVGAQYYANTTQDAVNNTGHVAWVDGVDQGNMADTLTEQGIVKFTNFPVTPGGGSSPTPTPTPIPTPSSSSSPTPSGSTPATPTPTQTTTSSSSGSSSSVSYDNYTPMTAPVLFKIETTATSATLYFSPINEPVSYYVIDYGKNKKANDYSVKFSQGYSPGVISYTINDLSPNTTYYFKVSAANKNTKGPESEVLSAKTTSQDTVTATSSRSGKVSPTPTPTITPSPTPAPLPTVTATPFSYSQTCPNPYTISGLPINVYKDGQIPNIPKVHGTIYSAVSDGNNGWYVGGIFTQIGSVKKKNLAHIKDTGIVDPAWGVDVNGQINSLALDNENTILYLGGTFTKIGTQTVTNVGAVTQESGIPLPWAPVVTDPVLSIALNSDGSKLYVTSCPTEPEPTATPIPTSTVTPVITSTPTAAPEPTIIPPTPVITSTPVIVPTTVPTPTIEETSTPLATPIEETPTPETTETPLITEPPSTVTEEPLSTETPQATPVEETDTETVVIDTTDPTDITEGPDVDGSILSVTTSYDDSTLIVGGNYTSIENSDNNNLAGLNLPSESVTDWEPNPNGKINTVVADEKEPIVYVAGDFTTVAGEDIERLAAINYETGEIVDWEIIIPSTFNKLRLELLTMPYVGEIYNFVNSLTKAEWVLLTIVSVSSFLSIVYGSIKIALTVGNTVRLSFISTIKLALDTFRSTLTTSKLLTPVLTLLGIPSLNKRQTNGIVFDSVTQKPIPNALVMLISNLGYIKSTHTNNFGRYGIVVDNGTYKLHVYKEGYYFPSKLVKVRQNLDFENIYLANDKIIISNNPFTNLAIPLDPIDKEVDRSIGKFIKQVFSYSLAVFKPPILFTFLMANIYIYIINPNMINGMLLSLSMSFVAIEIVYILTKNKKSGRITDLHGKPLNNSKVILYKITKDGRDFYTSVLTDKKGRYIITPEDGNYILEIKNDKQSLLTKNVFVNDENSYINEKIKLNII